MNVIGFLNEAILALATAEKTTSSSIIRLSRKSSAADLRHRLLMTVFYLRPAAVLARSGPKRIWHPEIRKCGRNVITWFGNGTNKKCCHFYLSSPWLMKRKWPRSSGGRPDSIRSPQVIPEQQSVNGLRDTGDGSSAATEDCLIEFASFAINVLLIH